jgi:threonine dehydrogenase-like Zn-dependent dehydrogenase
VILSKAPGPSPHPWRRPSCLDPWPPDVADQVRDATRGRGIGVAFDFAGAPPVPEQALPLLAPGGRLVLIAVAGTLVTIRRT